MHADFLIGPAGTGKTWRCLSEIRAALRTDSRLPLLMLAPKQATFQLERQLLATGEITAYARLQIVSFERFAEMILENLTGSPPRLVGEEGRRMVLRAILMDRLHDLTLFHASARLPGFARHLSDLFRLLQRSKIPPSRLTELAQQAGPETALGRKLSDLSLLLSSYIEWLTERRIEDEVRLMDFAAAALRTAPPEAFRIGGLWMDGFAELTPQELELLGAVLPRCERATLAFCVPEAFEQEPGWNSGWAIAGQTFLRCWQRVTQVEKLDAKVTRLNLDVQSPTRFLDNPALLHLAGNWMLRHPQVFPGDMPGRVRCVACSSLEAECILAAREVLEWVRSGGRFKELAVTVRSLEPYHAAISRVFTRYGVPFFMDRRETASHHPVAEFTRSAFRIAALGWRHDDVFSALKSGMTGICDYDVDWLEELSLRLGWDGCSWEADLPYRGDKKIDGDRVESLRVRVVPTLCRFVSELTRCGDPGPSGIECAASLRRLWAALDIEGQLRKWAEVGRVEWGQADRVHLTVWQQVSEWLDSFELAFENRRMPLSHWLPIVESGLSGLTVGVIPPALDQVLVGSIDRSRNPELKKMLVLGMNEGVFPAVPASSVLLTQRERESMAELDRLLGPGQRHQIGHEWYLAYAALTRASREVVISWAETGTDGEALHPSLFVSKLQAMFPLQPTERFDDSTQDGAWVHVREGLPLLLRLAAEGGERARQAVERSAAHGCDWRHQVRLKSMMTSELLSSSVAAQLYGNPLKTSVSALEDFAACPFKFFVGRGLGAKEREQFEVNPKERGSLQHLLLERFQAKLSEKPRVWRDLKPGEARAMITEVGKELCETHRGGLFIRDPRSAYVAERLMDSLAGMVEACVVWMSQYSLDPAHVEVSFGLEADGVPGLPVPLSNGKSMVLRGRIDRVDLLKDDESGEAWAVIVDYKSSPRELDEQKLRHGLQLQLMAYCEALRRQPAFAERWGYGAIRPVGAFYICLNAKNRNLPSLGAAGEAADNPHQHRGRFDADHLSLLDARGGVSKGDQLNYKRNKDGTFHANSVDPVSGVKFRSLMDQAMEKVTGFGERIYSGEMRPAPFQLKAEKACTFCEFQGVCRFDPWRDVYRVLGSDTADSTMEEG